VEVVRDTGQDEENEVNMETQIGMAALTGTGQHHDETEIDESTQGEIIIVTIETATTVEDTEIKTETMGETGAREVVTLERGRTATEIEVLTATETRIVTETVSLAPMLNVRVTQVPESASDPGQETGHAILAHATKAHQLPDKPRRTGAP
jgi:hypothetical protein